MFSKWINKVSKASCILSPGLRAGGEGVTNLRVIIKLSQFNLQLPTGTELGNKVW